MNRPLKVLMCGLLALAGTLGFGLAQARSNVHWSVEINAPAYPVPSAGVVYAQPVYVAPPAVVYGPPATVYVPRPVYVQPRPVYLYVQPAYYHDHRWRHQRRGEREHDDDD